MDGAGVYARESAALDRAIEVGIASGRVVSVAFPASTPEDAESDHDLLDRIDAHAAGTADDFADVEVGLTVPTDHRRVLEATRKFPPGETATLNRALRMAGLTPDDDDDRATAREALRANPVPLLLPDHRITDVDGATPEPVGRRLRAAEP